MCNIRVNIRQYYVKQYGLETARKIRQLEDQQTKRARFITSLNFLKRCRDHGLIPTCVKISAKKDIRGSAKILQQASQKLLIQEIRNHRAKLRSINKDIEILSNNIYRLMTPFDFKRCIEAINLRETSKYNACKVIKIQKYEKLLSKSNDNIRKRNVYERANHTPPLSTHRQTAVINLSKVTLSKSTEKVLEKGLNFALAPKRIPYETIICNVEDCLVKNNIGKEDLEAMRQDISSVLRRSKVPKPNLPKDELAALKNLRARPDIIVLRADKGNATVVMDTSDYKRKIEHLLSDETVYKKVKTDPTNKIIQKTKDIINKHSEQLNLDVKQLIPSCAKPPKLYGLPKIHKKDTPLRPIVSQIDSPTYRLARHVAKVLSPLRGNSKAHVKDSYHFVSEIKHLRLTDRETMVSFDVQSLFTSLPVHDCIVITRRKLLEYNMPVEYADILEHCLTSGYLLWDNNFYIQVDGIAMGSPVSPVVADIYMEDFEARALRTTTISPRIYKRYVDDTFTILPTDSVHAFLDHLNSINNTIQFTMELEANNSLAFLDVLVIRNPDHTIGHTVYRKQTHTDRYLNGESHHHPKQLATVGTSLFQRAHGICDEEHLDAELQHVTRVLRDNKLRQPRQGHKSREKPATVKRQPAILPYIRGVTDKIGYILKRASIDTYYKPPTKISQLLPSVKCHIPLQDAGVYKIDCECGLSYIGQTKRSIGTRLKEHIADIKHQRSLKSAVYEHTQQGPNHFLRFDKPQILAKENRFLPRMLREAIEIKKHPNFNREDGWNLPPAWDPVIHLIKPKKKPHTVRLQDTLSTFCVNLNTNNQN